MREVYQTTHRRKSGFSFTVDGKEYTEQVVNVTFKYSYKQFNQVMRYVFGTQQTFYVRAGYDFNDLCFDNGLAFDDDGLLLGVNTSVEVDAPYYRGDFEAFRYNDETHHYDLVPSRNATLLSKEELRKDLYVNGFYLDGNKYLRFKRSSGSSRLGKCLFIESALYHRMNVWEKCGIQLRVGKKVDLASWEAYISLTTSSIIDTLEIKPENILLIDDYHSTFEDNMLAVGLSGKWLTAEPKLAKISNCIWDGQSLMDTSLFGEKYHDKGMLLLRTRFFKSACFHTNIQQFFADMGITDVSQLNGKTCATKLEDIKLITTPSSIKYLKFGTFEQWLAKLEPTFGIVKYDKPSFFYDGRLVQCHYQLLNTLHMSRDDVEELLKPSHEYFRQLDENPAVFRHHVKWLSRDLMQFNCVNDICYYFLGVNSNFTKTKVFKDWKADVLRAFRDGLKQGHILIPGTYATLFGNPYEMLLQSIGKFDGTSSLGMGNISCSMFDDNEVLLGSRSPHVAAGNILLATNCKNDMIERYFNLSPYIVCINSINENILERLSGADMDSDTLLLTSEPLLVAKAKEHYNDFLVPTKLVPAQIKKRHYANADKADLDHVTANNKIGEIVNLSQELNSLFWDKLNHGATWDEVQDIYYDIGKLDVLSNIEIDRAKRECVVDSGKEMARIREKYNIVGDDDRKIKPAFFGFIAQRKGYYDSEKNNYKHHETTMDYVLDIVGKWRARKQSPRKIIPLEQIFKIDLPRIFPSRKVEAQKIIDRIKLHKCAVSGLWETHSKIDVRDRNARKCHIELIDAEIKQCVQDVANMKPHPKAIAWLLHILEEPENIRVRTTVLKILFGYDIYNVREFLREHEEPVPILEEREDGDINLYGMTFAEVSQ